MINSWKNEQTLHSPPSPSNKPPSVPAQRWRPEKRGIFDVHPRKLTWNLKITHLKRKNIFQTFIFGFHVNLPGCKYPRKVDHPHGWVSYFFPVPRWNTTACGHDAGHDPAGSEVGFRGVFFEIFRLKSSPIQAAPSQKRSWKLKWNFQGYHGWFECSLMFGKISNWCRYYQ